MTYPPSTLPPVQQLWANFKSWIVVQILLTIAAVILAALQFQRLLEEARYNRKMGLEYDYDPLPAWSFALITNFYFDIYKNINILYTTNKGLGTMHRHNTLSR